jgi:hypothetical protein
LCLNSEYQKQGDLLIPHPVLRKNEPSPAAKRRAKQMKRRAIADAAMVRPLAQRAGHRHRQDHDTDAHVRTAVEALGERSGGSFCEWS